jgi:hypothetical protein
MKKKLKKVKVLKRKFLMKPEIQLILIKLVIKKKDQF